MKIQTNFALFHCQIKTLVKRISKLCTQRKYEFPPFPISEDNKNSRIAAILFTAIKLESQQRYQTLLLFECIKLVVK